jgi:hypothetical protein
VHGLVSVIWRGIAQTHPYHSAGYSETTTNDLPVQKDLSLSSGADRCKEEPRNGKSIAAHLGDLCR